VKSSGSWAVDHEKILLKVSWSRRAALLVFEEARETLKSLEERRKVREN